jgi:putative restriction endonuclease
VDVSGTSTLQIERSEGVSEAFPDREFTEGVLSYSAIAELQRAFNGPDDVRAAYDCVVETGHSLTVKETRVWVEILMSAPDVTRATVRDEAEEYESLHTRAPDESVQRILDVHPEYESTYGRGKLTSSWS